MILKYKLYNLLYKISNRLPNWLFRFNEGTIYSTKSPELKLRENSKFIFDKVKDSNIKELSDFTGHSVSQLMARLNAKDIGIISRKKDSKKITSIQWAHIGNTYIRGLNLKLNIPENTAYLYWAYSAPEIRLTGVFNTAFQKMIDLLHEKNINNFYGLVEFWNNNAHKYHQRINFKEITSVLYLKIFFFRITFLVDINTKKTSCFISFLKIKDIDII